MLTVQLNDLELHLPENLKEFKLKNKIPFDRICDDLAIWLKDNLDESLDEFQWQYLTFICRALSEALDVPLDHLMSADISESLDENGFIDLGLVGKIFENHDYSSVENCILKIFNYVKSVSNSYEYNPIEIFEFDGEVWQVPKIVDKSYQRKKRDKISVYQLTKIQNIRKRIEKKNVNQTFESFLNMFCTLITNDEPLPIDAADFDLEVDKRVERFQEIDTQTVFDVNFFLLSGLVNLNNSKNINTSLIRQKANN